MQTERSCTMFEYLVQFINTCFTESKHVFYKSREHNESVTGLRLDIFSLKCPLYHHCHMQQEQRTTNDLSKNRCIAHMKPYMAQDQQCMIFTKVNAAASLPLHSRHYERLTSEFTTSEFTTAQQTLRDPDEYTTSELLYLAMLYSS